jgi:hypothetical protein
MQGKDLFFVIPTYRLRDVGETVEYYDEHFWRNGHLVRMIVFDDSSPANQDDHLPPFFPTRLRFEDYIYRLWVQQQGIVATHVDAGQNHTKSNYMRNPPAAEIFNEELANLLKRRIKATITRQEDLSIAFDYEGEVTAQDAQEILDKITALYRLAVEAAEAEPGGDLFLAPTRCVSEGNALALAYASG